MNVIELTEVTKSFNVAGKEVNILKSTDLVIRQGEFAAIVGPSGSGKSTLLTIMGALQKPTAGTIKINHKELNGMNSEELSDVRFSDIGFVLQASNLVPFLTIKEQFELKYKYSGEKTNPERISQIMEELDISHLQKKYPEDISGGERQRAAIGLALLREPKIILADEPTASLDTERAFEAIDIFKRISEKMETTVIMVTHDQRMLKKCDRVLEMKDGVLTEVDTK